MDRRCLGLLALCGLLAAVVFPAPIQGGKSKGSELVENLKFDDITWDVPELGVDVVLDTLPNGLVLFMMEDHRLPLVNVRALIRTGNMYDPEGKAGLARLTGAAMRVGGTESLDPDRFNEELEYIAASIEIWISDEAGNARLNCMSKDIGRGLELLADVLMNPAFEQERVDLEKDKLRESIRRRNDSPGDISSREFDHLIYGDHHYGAILEWASVKDITRPDLIAFHEKYFVPNNVWLGITGDFKIEDVKTTLLTVFDRWEALDVDFPEVPAVEPEPNPGVYLIDREMSQSHIRFGCLGVNMYNPDRFAIAVMNHVLGGGSFTSRMASEIRSNMGLAYSVGSRFSVGSRDLGTFRAFCQTKTESTCDAIAEMVKQIRRIREEPVSDDELQLAKDSFVNSLVFKLTDPYSIVSRLMNLEYDGMPRDFYQTYLDNVRSVTKDDLLRVANKYLDTKNMTYLVVGNRSAYEEELKPYGDLILLDLQDPVID